MAPPSIARALGGPRRLSQLGRAIPQATKKMLIDTLHTLEALGTCAVGIQKGRSAETRIRSGRLFAEFCRGRQRTAPGGNRDVRCRDRDGFRSGRYAVAAVLKSDRASGRHTAALRVAPRNTGSVIAVVILSALILSHLMFLGEDTCQHPPRSCTRPYDAAAFWMKKAATVIMVLTADDQVFELPVGFSERLHTRLSEEMNSDLPLPNEDVR